MNADRRTMLFTGLVLVFLASVFFRDLLITPIHGLADNKDFWRVMAPAGILYPARPTTTRFVYVQRNYWLAPPKVELATTSAVLPALFARGVSGVFSQDFDLRVLGGILTLIFLSGIFVLMRLLGSPLLVVGLAWISLEPTLYLHFNSFFSLALHLAIWPWLLWSFAATAKRMAENRVVGAAGWMLVLSAALVATSKQQFVLVPLILLGILLLWRIESAYENRRLYSSLGAVAIFSAAFGFWHYPAEKLEVERMSRYQAAFGGIAEVSDTPGRALHSLGIPADFHFLAGANLPETLMRGELPLQLMNSLDSYSRVRLLGLYLTEPAAIRRAGARAETALAQWPIGGLGQFEPKTLKSGQAISNALAFSRFRDSILIKHRALIWLLPLLVAMMIGQAAARKRMSTGTMLLCFLLAHFLTQLVVVIVGDGFFAIQRHFVVARLCWDLMLVFLLSETVAAARVMVRGRNVA